MLWIALLSMIAAPASSHLVHTADGPLMQKDGQGCRMIVPADLGRGAIRWIGACSRGSATGPGVLRVDRGRGDVALFAGTMREGYAGFPVTAGGLPKPAD